MIFKRNNSSNVRMTPKKSAYEHLSSTSTRVDKFSHKSQNILAKMEEHNKEITVHLKQLMDLNDILVRENKNLQSENIELRELLNGVNDMLYVTCPHCKMDQNITIADDIEGHTIMHELIIKGSALTICKNCGETYRVYNGDTEIKVSKD